MYIEAHEASWRNAKHHQQWRNTLAQYVLPVLGAMSVADVTTAEVMRILEPLWHDKTETGVRLRGRVENILDYAKTRGWREAENCARWKGHLANLLPPRRKAQRVAHHATLPWRETGAFMQRLWQDSSLGARCLEFRILTACRSGEVRGATWLEIDLDRARWAIVHDGGTIEYWQQPELAPWEVPKRDPHERRARAPDWEPELAAAEIAGLAAAEMRQLTETSA